MATPRSTRSVSVPIRVVGHSAMPISAARPIQPLQSKPAPKLTTKSPRTPSLSQLPEETKRRVMWWTVGVATVAVVIGWASLLDTKFSGRSFFDSTIKTIQNTFSSLRFGQREATAAEKEIRQLDAQVFPELSQ